MTIAALSLILATGIACPCDCDGNNTVAVDEIIAAIAAALGEPEASPCVAADSHHDGEVTVDEVLLGVTAALYGCGVALPATPTATPTPLRPDLLFTYFVAPSLSFSCAEDHEGLPRVIACIGNAGQGSAGPFVVTASQYLEWSIATLDPGGEICFSQHLQQTTPVTIDPYGAVDETDESNNERDIILPSLTRGPGCTPTPTPPDPSPTPTSTPLLSPTPSPTAVGACIAALAPDHARNVCGSFFDTTPLRHQCIGPQAGRSCFGIIASDTCCWSTSSDSPFLFNASSTGCGRREVCYDFAGNSTELPRDAVIRVGGREFKIRQAKR